MMKSYLYLCLFLLTGTGLMSQASGNIDLGSEITNGVMSDGCVTSCMPTYCSNQADNSGNHPTETMTVTITGIPATHSAELVFTTIMCGSTSGLDSGDDIFVDGVQIVDGNGNLSVNETVCVEGGADIVVEFLVNRRDEIINLAWESGLTDPLGCIMALLPVELSAFEGRVNDRQIDLKWTTSSEINNDKFIIEHSKEGRGFTAVGTEQGFGTTTDSRTYTFSHDAPAYGMNYYRLRQVDVDGTSTLSDVIAVEFKRESSLKVYPRLTSDVINIEGVADVDAMIYDMKGQLITTQFITRNTTMNVSEFEPGIYFLRIGTQAIRFMVR